MLKKLGLGLLVLVLAYLAVAALQPDHFRVERTILIKAPPERIFGLIDDFHAWERWSPWAHLDPGMKTVYGGTPAGDGAVYEWSGDKKVGRGRMEISAATPSTMVRIKLDFLEPFESHNVTTFTLEPESGGTTVRWAMEGPSPFVSRLIGVFLSMDDTVGKDFSTGLNQLKDVAEH
jgi:uncharacterized protein YndB with AHSA1/START domain